MGWEVRSRNGMTHINPPHLIIQFLIDDKHTESTGNGDCPHAIVQEQFQGDHAHSITRNVFVIQMGNLPGMEA